jgi:8-oxo-dGTP pyrophosphatase MutT (NUDIX family)
MARIFSYVITHDSGFAPNPFGGFLTLATCKPGIRRSAKIGDWILGTGSTRAVGKNRLVYAARVSEIRSIEEYGAEARFDVKQPSPRPKPGGPHGDNIYFKDARRQWHQRRNRHHTAKEIQRDLSGKNVLICDVFYYFGRCAPELPPNLLGLVKSGPGCKCEESSETVRALESWLDKHRPGVLGNPFMWLGKVRRSNMGGCKLQETEPSTPSKELRRRNEDIVYGGVLFDDNGRVLLREPTNHCDGYVWTFSKGRPDPGQSPEETAKREVREETGYDAEIIGKLPGEYKGGTSITEFFLMRPIGERGPFDGETQAIKWVSIQKATEYIKKTTNRVGRERDLQVLAAAIKEYQNRH